LNRGLSTVQVSSKLAKNRNQIPRGEFYIIGRIPKVLSALRQALHFCIDKEIFFVFNGFKEPPKFLASTGELTEKES